MTVPVRTRGLMKGPDMIDEQLYEDAAYARHRAREAAVAVAEAQGEADEADEAWYRARQRLKEAQREAIDKFDPEGQAEGAV